MDWHKQEIEHYRGVGVKDDEEEGCGIGESISDCVVL